MCGSSQTLALVDKAPFLLSWGNGDPVATTYSEIFEYDRPLKYDCGGKTAVIMTEKSNIYRINLETKQIERVKSKF